MHKFLNPYSILHFSLGVMVYFMGMSFRNWLIVHLIFNIVENKINKEYKKSSHEIISNLFLASIGWLIAYSLDDYGYKNGWYSKHIQN